MEESEKLERRTKCIETAFLERIGSFWSKQSFKIANTGFCQRFSSVKYYDMYFMPICWYLWKGYLADQVVDHETIRKEVILWFEEKMFDNIVLNYPDEYEEFFQNIQDFVEEATTRYYSGFIGKALAKWHVLTKKKPMKYKKLE